MDIEIKTTVTVTEERIEDLLCGALDAGYGGSNYWIGQWSSFMPSQLPKPEYSFYAPLCGGLLNIILVDDLEDLDDPEDENAIENLTKYVIDANALKIGLERMAKLYPDTHWYNFMADNDDAETADVFLQLCIFSELTYG